MGGEHSMERLNRFVRIGAVLGALALLILLATEGRAIAQAVRAALVENVDEPGRNPYSENATCSGVGCAVGFSPVPTGKRLVVTFVNGIVEGNNTSVAELGGHGAYFRIFTTTPEGTAGLFNAPTTAYYDPGEQPVLSCFCNGSFTSATLSGYYVTLP
jgi:hypothetical protein